MRVVNRFDQSFRSVPRFVNRKRKRAGIVVPIADPRQPLDIRWSEK